ncbi:MAG: HAD family hydrolase [Gemmatimonadota bacterium]
MTTAAFFDVDGTLVASNIVRYAVALRTAGRPAPARAVWTAGYLPRVGYFLALDAVSRAAFQRALYRGYRHWRPDTLRTAAQTLFRDHVEPRIYPQGAARVAAHQQRGDRVVLVTGSLEPIVAPLAERLGVTDVLAARLEEEGGEYTGELAGGPLAGADKARAISAFAEREGLDLARACGYADSLDDVPMLEVVGLPAVVNPSGRLRRLATARGWDIYRWSR